MRIFLLMILAALSLFADEPKPAPTVDQLQAKIALLEAKLDASEKTRLSDTASCWTDDLNVIQRRYEAALAQKKAAALMSKEPKNHP